MFARIGTVPQRAAFRGRASQTLQHHSGIWTGKWRSAPPRIRLRYTTIGRTQMELGKLRCFLVQSELGPRRVHHKVV